MFNKEWMDELKAKCDIASIVSRYVTLERKGRLLWGRCPFHGEKTPSFAVNEYDQFYHCFGCHAGGDVIKFVREIESVDFNEAIKILADIAHMEVPVDNSSSYDSEQIKKQKEKQDRLKNLMRETAIYYHKNLNLPEAKIHREYFENRKMSPQIINRFGLGASIGFNELEKHLSSLGFNKAEMLEAGVLKLKDGRVYDALGGRVIFPILNNYGDVVAFGGRSLEKKPDFAKYLNTAETVIFSKSKNLYAINLVKKLKTQGPIEYMIVVEGYIDVISLHKAGFTTAVASMGTALTLEQAKLIKRYTNKVYICYDGDSAGKNATLRGLEILRDNGLDVFIVSLPEPLDPDDVINKFGAEGYQKLLDKALPLLEFKLKYLSKSFDLSNLDGKTKYAASALDELKKTSEVERELYLGLVSEVSGLNIDFVRRMSKGEETGTPVQDNAGVQQKILPNTSYTREALPVDSSLIRAEKHVLSSILQKKNYAYPTNNYSYLFTGERARMFEFLFENRDKEKAELISLFYNNFADAGETGEDSASEIINISLSAGGQEHENAYYKDCLFLIYKRYLSEQIDKKTKELETVVETDRRRQILTEINELVKKTKNKKVDL